MGKALYRKYRSRSLDEVTGQSHVTDILRNAIQQDKIAHAYLFTGPRGVGKTSIARILAHEINELPYTDETSHLDIIEIDAASNNGVDDIRDLRSKVSLAPASAKKKIYIIDEVHMLSKPAFNALLKTLEEPPAHVVFILATTDLDKVPETIVSRTQRYGFKRASVADIMSLLTRIAKTEKIKIDDAALTLIANYADGSFRDSVSLLDQLSSISNSAITTESVEHALGLAPQDAMRTLLDAVNTHTLLDVLTQLRQLQSDGLQSTIMADQLIGLIQTHSDTYSELLPLMEKLITVRQSRLPDASLHAILGTHASEHKPTSRVAANVTAQPVAKELITLSNKAAELHPVDDIISPTLKKTKAIKPRPSSTTIDWTEILSDVSELSIGLRTVLTKCTLTNSDDTVTMYTRNEFYKKKLDTAKCRQELADLLTKKTGSEWELEFIPSVAPSKNHAVAAVAAMMGGGEEVSVD